jgi:hypothetical protein
MYQFKPFYEENSSIVYINEDVSFFPEGLAKRSLSIKRFTNLPSFLQNSLSGSN